MNKLVRWGLLLCALLLLGGCVNRMRPAQDDTLQAAARPDAVHSSTAHREEMTRVARAGMTTLYYDESCRGIALYDANSQTLWRSLPQTDTPNAAMLELELLVNGQSVTLNTQDHCPAETGLTVTETEDGLLLHYRFDAAVSDALRLQFELPLEIRVSDGCMHVSADCSLLQADALPRGVRFRSLSLLPFFGAQAAAGEDDFLLLPDGCGSVIRTQPEPETFDSRAIPVYRTGEDGAFAAVASFGQRVGAGAFVALAETGDALMTVHAEKRTKSGGWNRVYPAFTLTETAQDAQGRLFLAAGSYDGTLTVAYRFLADDTANAVGMGAACRELLIRNGTLDLLAPIRGDESFPFHLSLIGAANVQAPGEETGTLRTLTDFTQAHTLLEYLRSKDISPVHLCYRGLFLGGLAQQKVRLSSTVAQGQTLPAFLQDCKALGAAVFPEVRLTSGEARHLPQCARNAFGRRAQAAVSLLQTDCLSGTVTLANCGADRLRQRAQTLLYDLNRLQTAGVCLPDAALQLYTDTHSRRASTAQQMRELLDGSVSLFSAKQSLMLYGANLYAVKYASSLLEIPLTAHVTDSLTDAVPFLQTILHGYTFYSGEAMNLAADPQQAFLLAAQSGAVPYYAWYAADYSRDDVSDPLCYVHSISQAQQTYSALQHLLGDLSGEAITAFRVVQSGVTCTTFGTARIYVNFNDADADADGVTVAARSALRVDG